RRDRQRDGAVHARQLLDDDGEVGIGEPGASVLRREDDAQESHAAETAHEVDRELLGLVELARSRSDLPLGELPDRAARQLLFFGEAEIHSRLLKNLRITAAPTANSIARTRTDQVDALEAALARPLPPSEAGDDFQ